jgi:ribosomal-protein-alanine N-acetyltransferase
VTAAEAEAAAALHAAAFDAAAAARPWKAAEFLSFTASPGAFALVEPQALLLGRVAGPEADLATLAVHPQARRRGLARRLLDRFAAKAKAMGAEAAFLEVAEGNAPARALYAAAGWSEVGRRRGYYKRSCGTPEDALVLRLDLI